MPTDLSPRNGGPAYRDAVTGKGYDKKPEDMTHLRANLLVKKTHPRIALRGQLDELEAEIICLQVVTNRNGQVGLTVDLEDTLRYVREVLAAEVKETPLGQLTLFGLEEARLHEISHNVKGEIGIPHPVPSHTFGEVAAGLNLLRTKARVCELAALRAFEGEKNKRDDIVMALNRLSSGFYIMFCKALAENR
jgi:ethanolamine utilization cobalamin adenosyltransferase